MNEPLRTFEEMNQDGCHYDWAWPAINEAAVLAASRYGLTPYDPKNKVAIIAIVLAVVNKLNERGVLKIPHRDAHDFIMKSPTRFEGQR